jgi:hypothetical protein
LRHPPITIATSVFVAITAARSGNLVVAVAAATTATARPADKRTKMGALLGFWLVGVLCTTSQKNVEQDIYEYVDPKKNYNFLC